MMVEHFKRFALLLGTLSCAFVLSCGTSDDPDENPPPTVDPNCHVDCLFLGDCIDGEIRDYPNYGYPCGSGLNCSMRTPDYVVTNVCTAGCRIGRSGCIGDATAANCCAPTVEAASEITGRWKGTFRINGIEPTASVVAELSTDGFFVLTSTPALGVDCNRVEGSWGAADELFLGQGFCVRGPDEPRGAPLVFEAPFDKSVMVGQFKWGEHSNEERAWTLLKSP